MMFNLFANWQIQPGKPGIRIDGGLASQFLVIAIALFVIAFLLDVIFAYYLWKFNKQNYQAKIVNKPLIIISFLVPGLALIFGILLLIFWSQPVPIFGVNGADTLFATYISIAVLGYVSLIVSIVLMWVWLPKYALGLTRNQLVFVGDYIPFSKITKIVKDEENGNLYINYVVGNNNLKKQKFSLTSVFGQFLLVNANLTGHEVDITSERQYIENFNTMEVFEDDVEVDMEEATKAEETPTKKPAPKKTSKPTSQSKKSKVMKMSDGSKDNPVGTPVPQPKPVELDVEVETEITKHKIPKYKD